MMMLFEMLLVATLPPMRSPFIPLKTPEPSPLGGAPTSTPRCNLCAEQWVFVLSTGRAGSSSLVAALNSLPGVHISGENQGSLQAAAELYARHQQTSLRNLGTLRGHGSANNNALLCTLQQWYRESSGPAQTGPRPDDPTRTIFGFKELLSPPSRSVVQDREGSVPPARHLAVANPNAVEPSWLATLEDVFPCAKIM